MTALEQLRDFQKREFFLSELLLKELWVNLVNLGVPKRTDRNQIEIFGKLDRNHNEIFRKWEVRLGSRGYKITNKENL